MEKIIIFTDGSSRGNPGPGGWGAIVVWGLELKASGEGKIAEIGGREALTTNNRMEMKAVIEALSYLSAKHEALSSKLLIYCDSSYVINGATKWAKGWKENGWMTKAKGEVSNKDLWEEIITLTEKFNIEWKQIEGHAGIIGNERCDEIATSFADDTGIDLYNGSFENYKLDILSLAPSEALKKKSKSNSAKAYSYISLVDGKILIHKTWRECEARVKGKSGVRFKKSLSSADEAKIIEEFSNS